MRHLTHRAALAFAVLIAAAPSSARADLLIPLDEGSVVIKDHTAIISIVGPTETLIDEIGVRSSSRRFLWLRPYPYAPRRFDPPEKPFDTLRELTKVRAPYNELIRDDLFGPSIVSVLVDRLFREPDISVVDDADHIEPRVLDVGVTNSFSGPVTSSTTTYELYLPDGLAAYLSAAGVELDQKQIGELAAALNRGWVVAAAIVEDAAPAIDRPARIGPLGFSFRTSTTLYPMATRRSATGVAVPFEFFFVTKKPPVSNAHETIWDVRPWEGLRPRSGQFVVDYNDAIINETPIAIELLERLELPIPAKSRLLHSTFQHPRSDAREVLFIDARDPVAIPSGTRRGSGLDLFLSILLGLTPLLYTPESWFLLWIASRSRTRDPSGNGVGTKLWSVFAMIVGAYWIVVLPDVARIAGIVPLLIGIVQLGLPYANRTQAPVRVDFKRRAKN